MNRNMFVLLVVVLVTGGVVPARGQAGSPRVPEQAAPQPPLTFRAEVNFVEVDARVVDVQGNFMADLTDADFQLFEDGKPQKISVFSRVHIPVERTARPLFATRPIEPDVQTNDAGYNGRLYLLLLDDLHTHPLRSSRVRQAARQFIERYMGTNDLAAVVYSSGRTDAAQEFTSNPRLLVSATEKFMGRKLRSAFLGRLEQEQLTRGIRQPGERIDDPDTAERGFHARNTLDSVKALTDVLAGVRGRRKALVYFSEGIDYDIADPFNNRDAGTILDATREAIAAATRANVAIYGIDVRGLGAGADDAIEIQSLPDDTTLGLTSTAFQNEVRMGQDSLRVLADETGGFASVNTNDIAASFRRLVDENSSYYILGYYPSNDRRDGRFRRIEVRVTRPGLTVRARRGYVAPRGRASEPRLAGPNEASAELREAMSSPVPVSGLPVAATASVFKGPDRNGSVVVSTLVGTRDVAFVEKEGSFRNDLEILVMAVDAKGKVFPGDRNTINLTLKPDTLPRVRAAGFRVVTAIDLPPGRYQLRVAVREANTRRSGSVLCDVDVPDFFKEPMSMSSLALTSASSAVAPTARPKDPLAKLLPAPLTTYREFAQADEIALFTEVYEAAGAPPHKVEINTSLKAEGGQTVFQTREERDSSEIGGGAGGYGYAARIPLNDVAPGLYVLRVGAESRVGDRLAVSRETVVRITASAPSQTDESRTAPPERAAAPVVPAPPPAAAPGTAPTPAPVGPASAGKPGAAAAPVAPIPRTVRPVAFTAINGDVMSGIDRAEQRVVRSAEEWQTLWQQHAPGRPAPRVDFSANMVLAVFLGSRPSGGYEVQITAVSDDGDALVVEWAERRPGPGQLAAQVMTAPAQMVTVARQAREVRFVRVDR